MTAPCKGCGDREIGCHGSCPLYREYDEANQERRRLNNIEQSNKRALNKNISKWFADEAMRKKSRQLKNTKGDHA